MNEQYPLLFLTSVVTPIEYKTQGFGPTLTLPERDRQTHGDRLIATFQRIWQQVENIKNNRLAVSLPTKQGSYLEFKGSRGCDLATKSLEDIRVGIKLLNIREQEQEGVKETCATVFIPQGRESYFIKKVRKYIDEIDARNDLPKNFSLVNSIDDIKLAVLESFWTEPVEFIPNTDDEQYCELWLRSTIGNEENVLNQTIEICETLSIIFFNNRILYFPERIVCLIKANRTQLLELIEANPHFAEIRKAKEAASFWINEPNISQVEWANELLARVIVQQGNVDICILDTGINNGHPLLAPILSDNNCNSFDATWGVDDHNGHGTLMGGVSAYGDLEAALQSTESITLSHRLNSVKILPPRGENDPDMYGAITQQAISIAEISAPDRNHVFCCAVTSSMIDHKGKPTSWSSAIDAATSGQTDGERRYLLPLLEM